jgi:hypothetical protein
MDEGDARRLWGKVSNPASSEDRVIPVPPIPVQPSTPVRSVGYAMSLFDFLEDSSDRFLVEQK